VAPHGALAAASIIVGSTLAGIILKRIQKTAIGFYSNRVCYVVVGFDVQPSLLSFENVRIPWDVLGKS